MKGNYININADFVFDNTDLLKASLKEILLTIILTVILISIIILILKKKKLIFIINVYFVVILALVGVSIFDISKIIKEHNKLKNIQVDNKSSDIKIFNMSKTGENIFVFVLDRAINSYWLDALEIFTEYKYKFDGFVFYPNTVSFSRRTITIASLYGGYDYLPYEMSIDGNYNISDFQNKALLTILLSLEKYNYKSTVLNPVYVNFKSYSDLSIFKDYTNINAYNENIIYNDSISNYFADSSIDIDLSNSDNKKKKLIRISIFKMIPVNLREDFYRNGDWFYQSSLTINTSISSYAILKNIKNLINITNEGNYYNNLHNMTTHETAFFNASFFAIQ